MKSLPAFISCQNRAEYHLVESEMMQIRALATKSASSITLCESQDAAPVGSAVYTISPTITVFLDVSERVDAAMISKANEKLSKVKDSTVKQRKLIDDITSAGKASAATRQLELAKLAATEAEAQNLELSITQFEKLKI